MALNHLMGAGALAALLAARLALGALLAGLALALGTSNNINNLIQQPR